MNCHQLKYSTELIDSTLEVQKIEIDKNEVIFVEGKPW